MRGERISGTNDWQVTVDYANHSYFKGEYLTHIYAYNSSGSPVGCVSPERVYLGASYITQRSLLYYDSMTTTSSDGYTSSYTLYLNNALWGDGCDAVIEQYELNYHPYASIKVQGEQYSTTIGGKMNHVSGTNNWAYTVVGSLVGLYTTEIYVYNSELTYLKLPKNKVNLGNVTGKVIYYDRMYLSQIADQQTATITVINPQTDSGNSVLNMEFPTWRTGQTPTWMSGSVLGADSSKCYIWQISLKKSLFDNVAGTYNTHIYAVISPTERVFVGAVSPYTLK